MKKLRLITLIAILGAAIGAHAADLRIGPIAGANVSNFYFKQNLIGSNQLVGPNAGVISEVMFPGIGLGMDFGVHYQMHGANVAFGERPVWSTSGIGDTNVWVHSLQIPINLRFKYTNLNTFEHYAAPFVYAGPVFNITLAHSKTPWIEYPGGCVGLQVGLGGEFFEHLQVSAGYYWGLTYELRTVKLENFSARPQGWQVNVAWLF